MTKTVIYDHNSHESLLAAAILKKLNLGNPVDCRSQLPHEKLFIWLDVVPSKEYFKTFEETKNIENIIIACVRDEKAMKQNEVGKCNYPHSNNILFEKKESLHYKRTVSTKNILERVLKYFEINLTDYEQLIYFLNLFYEQNTPNEIIRIVVHNTQKAIDYLSGKTTDFELSNYELLTPIEVNQTYNDLTLKVKQILKSKICLDHYKPYNKGLAISVYTFYENELWWLIKRHLFSKNAVFRNISNSVNGYIVRVPSEKWIKFEVPSQDPVTIF